MAKVNLYDLEALFRELDASMKDIDSLITRVDSAFNTARADWESKGAEEFDTLWNGTFKPSLGKLTRAFADSGNDVGATHYKFADGAKELDIHPPLPKLTSPR